jgi:PhzF family phenazine biosynthesis protein
MGTPTPLIWVDAFTDVPYRGNPAAICLLDTPIAEDAMQSLAFELGLAETAYLSRRGSDEYDLRWFTPTVEVPLCGHATLASAHALFETGRASSPVTFHTLSGPLTCSRRADGLIEMDFPAVPPSPVDAPDGLLDSLGLHESDVLEVLDNRKWFVIEVTSPVIVESVSPDFAALGAIGEGGASVTARSDHTGCDIVSRVFGPGVGVDEDSVTGSVHCALTPYWCERLGVTELVAYQASARGGTLHCRLAGDRVHLAGPAVTVLRGEVDL